MSNRKSKSKKHPNQGGKSGTGVADSRAQTSAPSPEAVAIQVAAAVIDQIAAIGASDEERSTVVPA